MSPAISIIRNHWVLGCLPDFAAASQTLEEVEEEEEQEQLLVNIAQLAICKWQGKVALEVLPKARTAAKFPNSICGQWAGG